MRICWKSSDFEKRRRKNLPRCNQRDVLRPENKVPKMLRRNKKQSIIFPAGFSLPIAVDFIPNHSLVTRSPMSALLRRFVPILRAEWYPYTSKGLKRSVGAFVSRCHGAWFCLQSIKGNTERIAGRLGKSPSLSTAFPALNSTQFYLAELRQNAQGKGNA